MCDVVITAQAQTRRIRDIFYAGDEGKAHDED